jgi:hypothetical protein
MSKIKTALKVFINKPSNIPKLIVVNLSKAGALNWMPDPWYLKLNYFLIIGKRLDLKNPKTFNEKLQWLKLNDRKPDYTMLVDKYAVRKHIENTIGSEYLMPLLGVWESFDDIDFKKLPNQFVLKCTHDSGSVYICKDKKNIDLNMLKMKYNNFMKRNLFWHAREWSYKNVKPRIMCEKYLVDDSGLELKDYKFMCFNGEVKCSFVCLNRNSENGLNVDIYDMNWKLMPFERRDHPNSGNIILKPKNFDKMVKFAEILSKDMPFVRVDFYETNKQLYFGELTFFPGAGFEEFTPESFDALLGSWIKLPIKTNN